MLKKLSKIIKEYHPPKPLAFLFFVIPFYLILTHSMNMDNDTWFLINTGKHIMNHGIPTIEPFTMHQNLDFIAQQWLSTIIFYYIYKFTGLLGIYIFVRITYVIIVFLIYKLCMLLSEKRVHLSVIISSITGFLLSTIFISSRPQLFDYILLLLEIYYLELYIRKKNKKYLYSLPIISILMINLHCSSWLMLFAFLLPYLINSFKFKIFSIESEGYPKKELFITTLLMIAVGLINPYGVKAITYLLTSYNNFYINIIVREMNIPNIGTVDGKIVYIPVFITIIIYMIFRKSEIKIRYLLLMLGTLYLTISSYKGFSFYCIAGVIPLADYLKPYFRKYQKFHYSNDFIIKYIILVLIAIIICSAGVIQHKDLIYYIPEGRYNTGNYLKEKVKDPKSIKLYTNYNDGGYFEYLGFKPYIDARAEVFLKSNNHKKDIFREYYILERKGIVAEKFIKKYGFDYIISDSYDSIDFYLKSKYNKNYKRVYTCIEKHNGKKTRYNIYKKIDQ